MCTGSQFQEALLSHGGIKGVRVVAIDSMEDFSINDARKIPGISKLNNFKFYPESITAWCAYGIGCGKEINRPVSTSEVHTVLTSSIFFICCNCNLPYHLCAPKSPVHIRPHQCPWVCPSDCWTMHPSILLSLVNYVFGN